MSKTICKWLEEDEQMLVNPDGQVLPCCYLSQYFRAEDKPANLSGTLDPNTWEWDPISDQLYHRDLVNAEKRAEYLYKEYEKRKDKLNIFTNDLEDILNDEWFTKILPESWESEDTIAGACKRICTKCDDTV
tara:strand:+ start:393 stop:788 length:396 start_codon:yes stop_codon:yes gene_type:complete